MAKRVTARAVSKAGRATRKVAYGKKVYKPGQFVPKGARKKAFSLRSQIGKRADVKRIIRQLEEGLFTEEDIDFLRMVGFDEEEIEELIKKKGKVYRTMRVMVAEPKDPSIKTPVPLFEVGIFVYSKVAGAHTPESLKAELDRAVELVLAELNWNPRSFHHKMFSRYDREHWEDNVRVDEDEAQVRLDKPQRYMLWYKQTAGGPVIHGGHGSREHSIDRTDYNEAWFRKIEKREAGKE